MKLQLYRQKRNTARGQIVASSLTALAALIGTALLTAAVLSLLDRPLFAIAGASVAIYLVAGGLCGLFSGEWRFVGMLLATGLLCLIALVLGKGKIAPGAFLGYGVFLGSYFLVYWIPKRKIRFKRRHK